MRSLQRERSQEAESDDGHGGGGTGRARGRRLRFDGRGDGSVGGGVGGLSGRGGRDHDGAGRGLLLLLRGGGSGRRRGRGRRRDVDAGGLAQNDGGGERVLLVRGTAVRVDARRRLFDERLVGARALEVGQVAPGFFDASRQTGDLHIWLLSLASKLFGKKRGTYTTLGEGIELGGGHNGEGGSDGDGGEPHFDLFGGLLKRVWEGR